MTVGLYNKYVARFSEILYRGLLPGNRPSQEDGLQTYAIVLEACRNVLYRKGPNRLEEDELACLILGVQKHRFNILYGYLSPQEAPVRVLDKISFSENETMGYRAREIVAKARKAVEGEGEYGKNEFLEELRKEWKWREGIQKEMTSEGAQTGRRK